MEVKKRSQFGERFLGDDDDVFEHNAWDNVEWDDEQESAAKTAVELNAKTKVSEDLAVEYEEKSDEFWDKFYNIHQNRFFKNRNWLLTEFPELSPSGQSEEDSSVTSAAVDNLRSSESWVGEKSNYRVLEVGCGTGSTVFPLLEANADPGLMIYCCDLSNTAVSLVKEHANYGGRCSAFVCDVTTDWLNAPFPPQSLDVVTLIFMMSAVSPDKMAAVVENIRKYMKPGGLVLFRDYGRYDMAQLRFKSGKCIDDNFYVRGDGTRCYFFTQEDVRKLFQDHGFTEEQNVVDRRLQVNRGKKLKMYRIWIQAKYRLV